MTEILIWNLSKKKGGWGATRWIRLTHQSNCCFCNWHSPPELGVLAAHTLKSGERKNLPVANLSSTSDEWSSTRTLCRMFTFAILQIGKEDRYLQLRKQATKKHKLHRIHIYLNAAESYWINLFCLALCFLSENTLSLWVPWYSLGHQRLRHHILEFILCLFAFVARWCLDESGSFYNPLQFCAQTGYISLYGCVSLTFFKTCWINLNKPQSKSI